MNKILPSGFEIFKYSLKSKSVFDKAHKTDNTLKGIQINQSRKQIPLCATCHQRVHKGLYDGPGIY